MVMDGHLIHNIVTNSNNYVKLIMSLVTFFINYVTNILSNNISDSIE
jgi:hypothetical protein